MKWLQSDTIQEAHDLLKNTIDKVKNYVNKAEDELKTAVSNFDDALKFVKHFGVDYEIIELEYYFDFIALTINLNATHQELGTNQQDFLDEGFISVNREKDEPIQLQYYLKLQSLSEIEKLK